MRFSKVLSLLVVFMAAIQQAQADIAPDPGPVPPDNATALVIAGVCLSLAVVFSGLWFVNMRKQKQALLLVSSAKIVTTANDFNPVSPKGR
jgi:hypothetical protein